MTGAMTTSESANASASFTPAERDYIRRELSMFFSTLPTVAEGFALKLDTDKAGNYSYLVRDAAGVELNRIDYSVAGQGNVTRSSGV